MSENWFGPSFPKPFNKGSLTIFTILSCGGGGGGTSEFGGDVGEVRGGAGGDGVHKNPFLII